MIKQIPSSFYIFVAVTLWLPVLSIADDALSLLMGVYKNVLTVPDCSFEYSQKSHDGSTSRFRYLKDGERYSVHEFDKHGNVPNIISFDGSTYFYYDADEDLLELSSKPQGLTEQAFDGMFRSNPLFNPYSHINLHGAFYPGGFARFDALERNLTGASELGVLSEDSVTIDWDGGVQMDYKFEKLGERFCPFEITTRNGGFTGTWKIVSTHTVALDGVNYVMPSRIVSKWEVFPEIPGLPNPSYELEVDWNTFSLKSRRNPPEAFRIPSTIAKHLVDRDLIPE
jgi:hypothetical protein